MQLIKHYNLTLLSGLLIHTFLLFYSPVLKADGDLIDTVKIYTMLADETATIGGTLSFSVSINDTLCESAYEIELSVPGGSFDDQLKKWNVYIEEEHTGFNQFVELPNELGEDDCYKIRCNRILPDPLITGEASDCFKVVEVPKYINIKAAPLVFTDENDIMLDSMSMPGICKGSFLDVFFNSGDQFNMGNEYYIELSDSLGKYDDVLPNYIIGNKEDDGQYPFEEKPGTISGQIPLNKDLPVACGYYLRIGATVPDVKSGVWGPFCIRECDIMFNEAETLQVCLDKTKETLVSIPIDIHTWNEETIYGADNVFEAELRTQTFFTDIPVLSWLKKNDDFDYLEIAFPPIDNLKDDTGKLLFPNNYYLRIKASESNQKTDLWSNWINLNMGYIKENTLLTADNQVLCLGETVCLTIANPNQKSEYEWFFNGVSMGSTMGSINAECWESDEADNHYFQVRENNFACIGNYSNPVFITVVSPDVSLTITESNGFLELCEGECTNIEANFINKAQYEWSVSGGTIKNKDIRFLEICSLSGVEKATIGVTVTYPCGTLTAEKEIPVLEKPLLSYLCSDTTICAGETLEIYIATNADTIRWKQGEKLIQEGGDMLKIVPEKSSNYTLELINDYGCSIEKNFLVIVKECDTTTALININNPIKNKVYFYPNPSKNKTTLYCKTESMKNEQKLSLTLYDIAGKKIKTFPLLLNGFDNQHWDISLYDLSSGLYLFSLEGEKGVIMERGKLMVE